MIVRLLGGSDEVQGETPGPYVRTLWVRFGIYKQSTRALCIRSSVAKSLRGMLSNIQIPHDMDYVVRRDKECLSIGFGSYAKDMGSLRSASALWAEVPLNIPGLLKIIKHTTI
jgi:hypothetical protein